MALELKPNEAAKLLSLDGGGIKGISTLVILKAIMDRIKDIEIQKGWDKSTAARLPVDYFHMAGGTSTGGIIALMLFRLRMSTDLVIKEYMAIGPDVFGTLAKSGPAKFDENPMIKCINEVVQKYAKTQDDKDNEGDAKLVDNQAMMFMCATLKDRGESVLLRSYTMPKDARPVNDKGEPLYDIGLLENMTITTAARATSAAPTYLPDVPLVGKDKKKIVFWDGGLLNNNPIDQLWRARLDLVGDNDPAPKVSCVLSLGTSWSTKGPPTAAEKWKALSYLEKLAKLGGEYGDYLSRLIAWIAPAEESINFLTNTEAKHMDFSRYISRISHRAAEADAKTQYFRFNTPTGSEYIDMADYSKMKWLKTTTESWVKDPSTIVWIDKVANLLAKKK